MKAIFCFPVCCELVSDDCKVWNLFLKLHALMQVKATLVNLSTSNPCGHNHILGIKIFIGWKAEALNKCQGMSMLKFCGSDQDLGAALASLVGFAVVLY